MRLLRSLYRVASLIVFLIALPVLYLIEPFWHIRIGDISDSRIGHLAPNLDLFVRQGLEPRTTFILVSPYPANRYLLNMWRRYFVIFENLWLKRSLLAVLPLLRFTRFYLPLPYTGKEAFPGPPVLEFTPWEDLKGREFLARMGVDSWFVCFHARDPAYLESLLGKHTTNSDNLRNCSIENYREAAEWITAQGGFAICMGSGDHSGFTDYAPNDFMDLYLISKCRFFLGCASGLHTVAYLFNKPFAGANFCPLDELPNALYIPKILYRHGKPVSFRELKGLFYATYPGRTAAEFYASLGLEQRENSPSDILGLCKDMMARLDGVPPKGEIQTAYGEFHTGRALLGPRFALEHRKLIMDARPRA